MGNIVFSDIDERNKILDNDSQVISRCFSWQFALTINNPKDASTYPQQMKKKPTKNGVEIHLRNWTIDFTAVIGGLRKGQINTS